MLTGSRGYILSVASSPNVYICDTTPTSLVSNLVTSFPQGILVSQPSVLLVTQIFTSTTYTSQNMDRPLLLMNMANSRWKVTERILSWYVAAITLLSLSSKFMREHMFCKDGQNSFKHLSFTFSVEGAGGTLQDPGGAPAGLLRGGSVVSVRWCCFNSGSRNTRCLGDLVALARPGDDQPPCKRPWHRHTCFRPPTGTGTSSPSPSTCRPGLTWPRLHSGVGVWEGGGGVCFLLPSNRRAALPRGNREPLSQPVGCNYKLWSPATLPPKFVLPWVFSFSPRVKYSFLISVSYPFIKV